LLFEPFRADKACAMIRGTRVRVVENLRSIK